MALNFFLYSQAEYLQWIVFTQKYVRSYWKKLDIILNNWILSLDLNFLRYFVTSDQNFFGYKSTFKYKFLVNLHFLRLDGTKICAMC